MITLKLTGNASFEQRELAQASSLTQELLTRRYGSATLIQIAAVPVAFAAPRVGVVIALLCVTFFLLPQPKPRYKSGEQPTETEKLNE